MHDPFLSEVASNIAIETVRETVARGQNVTSKFVKMMRLKFTRDLPEYRARKYEKLKEIPSLFLSGEPLNILNSFHQMNLTDPNKLNCHEDDLLARCNAGYSFAIEAQAGYGKSFLLRYLFLRLSDQSERTYFPLFVELRDINTIKFNSIYDLLMSETGLSGAPGLEALKYGLSKGIFILFFDAFDEIRLVNRELFLSGLSEIRSNYPKTPIVVSGRQNDYFPIWGRLPVYYINPLTLGHVRSLIATAPGSIKRREAFLDRLTPEFYKKYESFLSNPLLALLMLLVFSSSGAQLPSQQSEFFERAYIALCIGLDSIKTFYNDQAYRRIFQSNLKYGDFGRIFSVFSAITYASGQLEFNEIEIEDLMTDSIRKANIALRNDELDARDVVTDFFESICLFRRDGHIFTYTHRSFQEYFCAKFFAASAGDKLSRFLDRSLYRINDDVLPMLFEMNPDKVFFDWIDPALNELIQEDVTYQTTGEQLLLKGWSSMVIALDDDRDLFFHYEANSTGRKLLTLARLFPSEFRKFDRLYRPATRRKFVELDPKIARSVLSNAEEKFQIAMNDLENERKDHKLFMVRRVPLEVTDIPLLRELGLTRSAEDDHSALLKIRRICDLALNNYNELDNDLF